jgi:V/A-type H+-transporting ATPase subunit F
MADIVVVGKRDSILGFKTIGLEAVFWENTEESLPHLEKYIEDGVKIVFITEKVFQEIPSFIEKYFGKLYPVFVPIPDIEGSQGIGYENIRNLVIRALGTDVFGE